MKMISDNHILLAILLLGSFCAYAAAQPSSSDIGNWTRINDLSDPCVKMIANYSVGEYNRRRTPPARLTLLKILMGWEQVVSGIKYRLNLRTLDLLNKTQDYEAIVWVKTWEHFRNLTSFKPINP